MGSMLQHVTMSTGEIRSDFQCILCRYLPTYDILSMYSTYMSVNPPGTQINRHLDDAKMQIMN